MRRSKQLSLLRMNPSSPKLPLCMPNETIVLVHGLWMTGLELSVLHHRLEHAYGFHCVRFSYHSVTGSMSGHVRQLRELAQSQRCDRLHFVGHSLGGIVVYNLLTATQDLPPGRVVLLGSPVQGSCVAQSLAQWKLGRLAVGHTICEELVNRPSRRWDGRRELGVIAGSLSVGFGRFLSPDLATDSDGTVRIAETQLEGAADRIVLHVTHTSMVFSAEVARQVATFLRAGRFEH